MLRPSARLFTAVHRTRCPPFVSLRKYTTPSRIPPSNAYSFSSSTRININKSTSTKSNSESASEQYRRAAREKRDQKNQTVLLYAAATIVLCVGVTYAAVPLYRMFCAATGFGGIPMTNVHLGKDRFKPLEEGRAKPIKVMFNSDVSDSLPWSFTPQQRYIYVKPGETALAFYTAKNNSKEDIIGIATYNVIPVQMAPYFAKIECFCFDEQKIAAGEEVDLPIFFFIDRDFVDDPQMRNIEDIVLSYTFFRAKRNKYGHLEPDGAPL